MVDAVAAFSGFSVNDANKAKDFYQQTVGLKLVNEEMGLRFELPNGGTVFIYEKEDHAPATFTILNFVVEDIDATVGSLKEAGVTFEHYDNLGMDESNIARGIAANRGPDIAWFKDPSGNILSVLKEA